MWESGNLDHRERNGVSVRKRAQSLQSTLQGFWIVSVGALGDRSQGAEQGCQGQSGCQTGASSDHARSPCWGKDVSPRCQAEPASTANGHGPGALVTSSAETALGHAAVQDSEL